MLCALHGEERLLGPRVDEARARALSAAGSLRCPSCDAPVLYRAGERVIAHFAHRAGAACALADDPDYRPESELHLSLKLALHDWLRAAHPAAPVELEAPIPATGQRADLLATIDGRPIAFEVQCSPLSGAAWRARHEGYARAGVRDVWILAGQAPRFAMIPGSERRGLPPTWRFHLRDLAATIVHHTGELLLAWRRVAWRERGSAPLFHLLQKEAPPGDGPLLAALGARAAHQARSGAGPWSERPFRDRLVLGGAFVSVAPLGACALDPVAGLVVGERHAALRRAAAVERARARAEGT